MSILARAIATNQWELAALCLLLGLLEAAIKVPPDSLDGLVEVVGDGEDGRR